MYVSMLDKCFNSSNHLQLFVEGTVVIFLSSCQFCVQWCGLGDTVPFKQMPSSQRGLISFSFVYRRQFPNTSALYHPRDVRDSTTLCIPVPVAFDGQAIKDHLWHLLRFGTELILSSNYHEKSDLVLYDDTASQYIHHTGINLPWKMLLSVRKWRQYCGLPCLSIFL